jgi:hypothetical protein
VLTDFELAARHAFAAIFPNDRVRGCYFHFCQCLWRKVQQIPDLVQRYLADDEFALQLREVASLAFVPTPHVVQKFEQLLADQFFVDNEVVLEPFLSYFEDTWIGRPRANGQPRRAPKFNHESWNCHEGTLQGLAKTNNFVEAWHRGFSSVVISHSKIYPFITELKKEQVKNAFVIEQIIAGTEVHQGKKYRDTARAIKTIVEDYENRELMDYLRGLAYNFKLQAHS